MIEEVFGGNISSTLLNILTPLFSNVGDKVIGEPISKPLLLKKRT